MTADLAEIEACLRVGTCRSHEDRQTCATCQRMERAIAMLHELGARLSPANEAPKSPPPPALAIVEALRSEGWAVGPTLVLVGDRPRAYVSAMRDGETLTGEGDTETAALSELRWRATRGRAA